MNVFDASKEAVKRLEEALKKAGWKDGWGLQDKAVREAEQPLFYRNSTSATALDAKVDGHCLYLIYNIIDSRSYYSSNKPYMSSVTIALTFYYDDACLLDYEPHSSYISNLLAILEDEAWLVSSNGDDNAPVSDTEEPYLSRKILYASRTYS